MDKKQMPNSSRNMSVPLDVQVRLAEIKRKLAIIRYKLGVRRGAAWFKADETESPKNEVEKTVKW